ncbi:hypothetical protein Q2941_45495 [Bradyrhizobium sp. UFLA05-153]
MLAQRQSGAAFNFFDGDREGISLRSGADGDWRTGGYLAGLQKLIDAELSWAAENAPKLVEAAQQSLKRLFPLLVSDAFTLPKDLINTSSREERTRFYHHEYQNKLLVGLAEFLLKCARERNERHIIVIDRAAALSNSAKNLIKLLVRLDDDARLFRFVLIDYEQRLYFPDANEAHFGRYSSQELGPILDRDLAVEKQRQIYEASGGNPLIAEALSKCEAAGLPVIGYLDPIAIVDLYLASFNTGERHSLLKSYIESDCTTPNLIAQRNYAIFEHATADHLHEQLHRACPDRYMAGEAPLVMLHALSVRDKYKRLELLAEPSEILQSIGLYDLWFGYFSEIFAMSLDAVLPVVIASSSAMLGLGQIFAAAAHTHMVSSVAPDRAGRLSVLFQCCTYSDVAGNGIVFSLLGDRLPFGMIVLICTASAFLAFATFRGQIRACSSFVSCRSIDPRSTLCHGISCSF